MIRPMSARRTLTAETILLKTRVAALAEVRNLNLWGENLEDISVITQLRHVEVIALVSNRITMLRPFAACPKLQELYLRKNRIESLAELNALRGLQHLHTMWLMDNPCAHQVHYRAFALFCCPHLHHLDDVAVTKEEREAANALMTPQFVEQLLRAQPTKSPARTPPTPSTPSPRPASASKERRDRIGEVQQIIRAKRSPEKKRLSPVAPSSGKSPLPLPLAAPPTVTRTKAPSSNSGSESSRLTPQEPVVAAVQALLPVLTAESLEKLQKEIAERLLKERKRAGAAG